MASKTESFRASISTAIDVLFKKGYLLNNLDWDIKGNKYTLRIRGADRRPMVGVGLITFNGTSGNVSLINAVTGQKTSLKVDFQSDEGIRAYLDSVLCFAQQLREEAAYK